MDATKFSTWRPKIMPNKYPEKKGWNVPKQKYRVSNWTDYTDSLPNAVTLRFGYLRMRYPSGMRPTEFMMEQERQGYTDFAIITCHEIRLVYKLPYGSVRASLTPCFNSEDPRYRVLISVY